MRPQCSRCCLIRGGAFLLPLLAFAFTSFEPSKQLYKNFFVDDDTQTKAAKPYLRDRYSTSIPVAEKTLITSSTTSDESSSSAANSTTSNTTLPTTPSFPSFFYTCGYPVDYMLHLLYPELQNATPIAFFKEGNFSKSDFLILGEHGFCCGWRKRKLGPDYFRENFPGTTIIVNGESFENGQGEEWDLGFFLGYRKDSWRHVRVYFVATVLVRLEEKERSRILDPSQKPINTGERFLIYAASNAVEFRQRAFDAMAEIDVVHQGGKSSGLNYTSTNSEKVKMVPKEEMRTEWRHNYENFSKYKFCLVLENQKLEGYITEKILNAFLAGCIPIYYGTTEVFDIFNEKAFIYYDVENPSPAINQVKYLHRNRTAYDEVIAETILVNGTLTAEKYFSLSDDIGGGMLRKRIRGMIDEARGKALIERIQ